MDKKALHDFSYGMYLIGSSDESRLNSQIANSVVQVSSEPIIFSVCINKDNLSHEFIEKNKIFSISILSEEAPLEFIGWFGFRTGKKINKFDNELFSFNYFIENVDGIRVPLVKDYSLSYLILKVISSQDVGTHTVFFGKLIDSKKISDMSPMTYKFYHEIKGGLTQMRAPSYTK